jgi:hypothetical protein
MATSRLDVSETLTIQSPPERVAAIMFAPAYDSRWMKAVKKVEVLDPEPIVGQRVRRWGSFLGKTICWVTELREYEPPRRLVLRIAEGPFVGDVTYEIVEAGSGSAVTIRNQGEPGQFSWMPRWLVALAMKGALRSDLRRLQELASSPESG